jgi:precorrin-6A/cobalt-precorrin-6A reductase
MPSAKGTGQTSRSAASAGRSESCRVDPATISAASSAARLAGASPSGQSSPMPTIVSHGASAIAAKPRILVLGGTTEAASLARALAARGADAVLSLAGRTATPAAQALPLRIGGFGGAEGLAAWLGAERITHLLDATHPFAAQMSRNAVEAAARTGTPLLALTRPPWRPGPGDDWREVPDMAAAVAALPALPTRIFLGIGRQALAAFAARPEHHYLLRLADPPGAPLPLPRAEAVIARGPFDAAGDETLLRAHRIAIVVSKNSGGNGAAAKLEAARALRLPVIMIARPALPRRDEVHDVAAVLHWLDASTARGV